MFLYLSFSSVISSCHVPENGVLLYVFDIFSSRAFNPSNSLCQPWFSCFLQHILIHFLKSNVIKTNPWDEMDEKESNEQQEYTNANKLIKWSWNNEMFADWKGFNAKQNRQKNDITKWLFKIYETSGNLGKLMKAFQIRNIFKVFPLWALCFALCHAVWYC